MTNAGKSIGSEVELQRWVPERTIVLVGLMGAGKSSVGRKLATRIGRPFVDADAEIELAANCTIREIFERMGEAAFREGERRVMARLLDGPLAVVAAGGGAFAEAETRAVIAAKGLSVWLRAELDVLVRRTAGRSHRPLLNAGEPREVLQRLMDKRHPSTHARAKWLRSTKPPRAASSACTEIRKLHTLSSAIR
jgi:shikimate kinase